MAADRLGSISPLAGYEIRQAHDDVHENIIADRRTPFRRASMPTPPFHSSSCSSAS
jgi:hypothetical protein